MASSNIKLFDENKGNMLTDTEFNISNQRMNGLQTGVASSQLQNKAMYQASLVAYAIAQVMMQNGLNANDTDAVSAFVANLSGTMLQKVYDIATTEEAKAGVATGKWMSPALVKAAIDKTLTDKNYLSKSGGTMTGNLILNANPTANLGAATKQYVDSAQSACLPKSGGTMTGNLILNANPSANLGAATKQYVDTQVNNVKSALTPVFGDLAKDGYFKLGDMSIDTSDSRSNKFVYDGFYNFLNSNISKLNEIVILIKNSVWQNTYTSNGYSLTISNGSSELSFTYFGASASGIVDRTCKLMVAGNTFTSNGPSYNVFLLGSNNNALLFSKDYSFIRIASNNPNYLKATSIGTAEIWYK